jgi:predicted CXXCH cytochrome family protein
MSSPLRDPKTLAEWLELDYFRRPRWPRRLRRLVTWTVAIAGAAVLVLTFWPGALWVYESAPVSAAHAMFNDQCTRCHTDSFRPALRFLPSNIQDLSVSVLDPTCEQCHEGPKHNPHQSRDPSCASCHREHSGRPILARVEDRFCTDCHKELANNHDPTVPLTVASTITRFKQDEHPPFREREDLGQIAFNHKVHLHLKDQALSCERCHQEDAKRRYMKPIRYDDHCQECHPLGVQVQGTMPDEATRRAAEEFRKKPAPHPHQDAEEVRQALRERFTNFVQVNPAVLSSRQSNSGERAIPGLPQPDKVNKEQWTWVNQQLGEAERILFEQKNAGCRYCHLPHDPAADSNRGFRVPQFDRTAIRSRWYDASRFSHGSHQVIQCDQCHAGARQSQKTSDVLLPSIENCQKCHKPKGGARNDCIECHDYHGPRQGGRVMKSTIDEFLQGSRTTQATNPK